MYRFELQQAGPRHCKRQLTCAAQAALLLLALLLRAPTLVAQTPAADWLIEPGLRVGPITVDTSELALASLFGADNIEAIAVQIGEGFTEPGTVIYPDDPARRIEVIWHDETRSSPASAWLQGDSSMWQTREGISLGTTLKEIERLNGYPFRLAGFGWDLGGTITDCGRGRLLMLRCTQTGNDTSRMLVLRLGTFRSVTDPFMYAQVQGDREFSSGHPAMQEINPVVRQMIVYFRPRTAGDGNTGKPAPRAAQQQ